MHNYIYQCINKRQEIIRDQHHELEIQWHQRNLLAYYIWTKIENIIEKNVVDIDFKLLHNMLPNDVYICKLKKDITKSSKTCQE